MKLVWVCFETYLFTCCSSSTRVSPSSLALQHLSLWCFTDSALTVQQTNTSYNLIFQHQSSLLPLSYSAHYTYLENKTHFLQTRSIFYLFDVKDNKKDQDNCRFTKVDFSLCILKSIRRFNITMRYCSNFNYAENNPWKSKSFRINPKQKCQLKAKLLNTRHSVK